MEDKFNTIAQNKIHQNVCLSVNKIFNTLNIKLTYELKPVLCGYIKMVSKLM